MTARKDSVALPEALHVWEHGQCYMVAAYDLDGAWHFLLDHIGGDREDYDDAWRQVPDDEPVGFWCDADGEIDMIEADGADVIEKPASEWAKLGARYLGSLE